MRWYSPFHWFLCILSLGGLALGVYGFWRFREQPPALSELGTVSGRVRATETVAGRSGHVTIYLEGFDGKFSYSSENRHFSRLKRAVDSGAVPTGERVTIWFNDGGWVLYGGPLRTIWQLQTAEELLLSYDQSVCDHRDAGRLGLVAGLFFVPTSLFSLVYVLRDWRQPEPRLRPRWKEWER